MSAISEYVVQGALKTTAGEVANFHQHTAAYRLKAETLAEVHDGKLRDLALFMIQFVEDVLDDAYDPKDLSTVSEAIFAIRYLAKGTDIIPDSVPGGYADDLEVLNVVWRAHHAEFSRFSEKSSLPMPDLQP